MRASVGYSESLVCIITWAKAWCRWDLGCWELVSGWLSFLTHVEDTKSKEADERRFGSLDYVSRQVVSAWMKLGYDFQKKSSLGKGKKLIDSRYTVSFQSSHALMYASWFLLLFLYIYYFVKLTRDMGMIFCPIYNLQIMNI